MLRSICQSTKADRVDNQIDVLGKTFLGLTLGCARCHDHKFDAISSADVYSLWGFAKSTRLQTAYLDPHGKIAAAAHEIADIQRQTMADLPPSTFSQPSQNQAAARSDDASGEVFADFNYADFGDWHASGEAFGRRPTRTGDWTSRDGKARSSPSAAPTAAASPTSWLAPCGRETLRSKSRRSLIASRVKTPKFV